MNAADAQLANTARTAMRCFTEETLMRMSIGVKPASGCDEKESRTTGNP